MKLTKGTKYDVAALRCTGWTPEGAEVNGYNVADYFAADGTYLGADEYGIEPEFEMRGSAE
mgnify:CR=1 FL=1